MDAALRRLLGKGWVLLGAVPGDGTAKFVLWEYLVSCTLYL